MSRTTWHLSLRDWRISPSIISSRVIHVVVGVRMSFLFKAESYSLAQTHHIVCIHSLSHGHLSCFHLWAVVTLLERGCANICLCPWSSLH